MFLLCCAVALSGCTVIERIKNNTNSVNTNNLSTAWPEEPIDNTDGTPYTEEDVLLYIIEGRGAYNDCSAKLKACMKE